MEPASTGSLSLRADGVSRLALLALVLLLPTFFIPVQWASLAQSKMILIAGLALIASIAWWIARTSEGALHIPRTAFLWVIALLPAAYLISAAAAGLPGSSLIGQGIEQDTLAAVAVWFALSALAMLGFAGRSDIMHLAVKTLVLGLTALFTFQSLYALAPSVFSLGGLLVSGTANIAGSWHDLGILAGVGLFLATALLYMRAFAGPWRVALGALGASSFFLLILIHFSDIFWGVFVLMALGAVFVIYSRVRGEGSSYSHAALYAWPIVALSVLFFGLALYGPRIVDFLPTNLQVTQVEVRPSWQGTFDVARQTLSAPTSVVFGSGPNSFTRAWGQYKPLDVNQTPFWDSDFNLGVGVIPTSIMSAGVFGLLAWLAIVLSILGVAFRFVRDMRPLADARLLLGVFLAASVYLLVFHFIYTPGASVTGLTFLALGLLAGAAAGDAPMRVLRLGVRNTKEILTIICMFAFTMLILASAGLVAREILSNMHVNRAAAAYQLNSDTAAAIRSVQTALAISPKNDRAHRAAAELGLIELTRLAGEADASNAEAAAKLQETLQSTIQHGLTAVSIDDANYQNWLALATVYGNLAGSEVEGALDASIEAYQKAAEANPRNPTPLMRLAQLAVARNDIEGARGYLNSVIALKPDIALAHFMRSQIEASQGNGDAAVAAAAETVRLVPQEPVAWYNLGYILFLGGVYADAGMAFEQAVALQPEYANALYLLSLTYAQLGMTNESLQALGKVLELNPGATWIYAVAENIEAGRSPLEGLTAGEEQSTRQ